MSYYVWGSKMSYADYLTAGSFVDDLSAVAKDASRRVSMEISHKTREIIASNEALTRENIRAMEFTTDQITGELSEGFDRLSYDLKDISTGISELNSTFHWGFSEQIAGIGRMNDSLSELIKIAKTPAQSAAYEQYEIGRDAFRQGLYPECLEALEKAINGDHTSPGYKLEWRFYQMKSVLYLGFEGCDLSYVDLEKAEAAFLLAARYARKDYPVHAAQSLLSAGWAAYCQGKMKDALAYTEEALSLHPGFGEAFFQAAKVLMATGEIKKAFPSLGKAIELDRFYLLKAAGDGDFKNHEEQLRSFIEALREEKCRQGVAKVQTELEKLRFFCKHYPKVKNDNDLNRILNDLKRILAVLSEVEERPLYDLLAVTQSLNEKSSDIHTRYKDKIVGVTHKNSTVPRSFHQTDLVEERYQEEVVLKPGGLFRKEVKEIQTKTREVIKSMTVTRNCEDIRIDFYTIIEELIISIEFCMIPAGEFIMVDGERQQSVVLARDFYIGKYPVTQAQWEAVMGENPSHYKGDPNLPVEQVSWEDTHKFIKKLNEIEGGNAYRLPTEAEWEYACRAGTTTLFSFGDDADKLDKYAWYIDNSKDRTHPVGEKKPNAWGIYDMHGNVLEWVEDDYEVYNGAKKDGRARIGEPRGANRVFRGGHCKRNAHGCQSADRNGREPDYSSFATGFRLAKSVTLSS